jgi:hypothetical protein
VSAELCPSIAGWDGVRGALSEIRAVHEEFGTFFTGVFDELGVIGAAVRARAEHLRHKAEHPAAPSPPDSSLLEPLVGELRKQQDAVVESRKLMERQADHLASLIREFASARQDGSAARGEEEAACRERAELEAELEAIRSRAAEMAASLEIEKRRAELQQAQWGEELRGVRRLLEELVTRRVETAAPAGVQATAPDPSEVGPAPRPPDPALDSVMAQFEMLQKDIARRRAAG